MSSPNPSPATRASSRRARFTTACQQLLTLAVVCAALTPAARVMTLELVPEGPAAGARPGGSAPAAELGAFLATTTVPTEVPTGVVDPVVREVPLTAPAGARVAPGALEVQVARRAPGGRTEIVSTPQPVSGYGSIGVTWAHGDAVADDRIGVQVRTQVAGRWTGWSDVEYHEDHGPDPTSPEGRRARPGTEPVVVGDVDRVQVKVDARTAPPSDLSLSVIDPGQARGTAKELPAIDTGAGTAEPAVATPDTAPSVGTGDADVTATLARAKVTPRPQIYSRAQWGADERMRDASSLRYYEVHAGFVHHTVNANNYAARDVPGILRSIYAYHTRSKGWSDIGYNFLVDRFGRIWEGRAGGVDRPVVGAHTLGYNDYSFAMSAIGNFETARPSSAMVQAYGALFGWKLSLHGVSASSTRQAVGSKAFPAVNGHRDAGSTACPGKYLYAQIPQIRTLAQRAQASFTGRELESNLVGSAEPDLVARRTSDKKAVILPIVKAADGRYRLGRAINTGIDLTNADRIINVGDWDRNGHSDLVLRHARNGVLYLKPGNGNGTFGPVRRLATGFKGVDLLAGMGDMTGDGWPDLMGQPRGGPMRIYPGYGLNGVRPSFVAYGNVRASRQIPIGRWGPDGAPDSLFQIGAQIVARDGNGPGGLTSTTRRVPLDPRTFDWVVGIRDVGLTGHADLVVRTRAKGSVWLVAGSTSRLGTPVKLGDAPGYDLVG